jgi:folate-dependent phosphoribosylglycinamide formyltransferase PurN
MDFGLSEPSPPSGSPLPGKGADPESLPVRAVVLCCDGLYQRTLVQRAQSHFHLVGVVVQHPPQASAARRWDRLRRYRDPRAVLRQAWSRLALRPYQRRGRELEDRLFRPEGCEPALPMDVPVHHTSAINGAETVEYLRDLAPELILVNGTQLLREPILSLRPQIRHGILNLHTGLSPYSRGANCNLYMVLEGHPELVGVTVHHIDPGIDSGDIIRSAQVPMEPDDNFETIDVRSFDVGINLLLEGARDLVEGRALRVRQWEQGKLFLQRTGYHYEPWQRLQANRLLKQGMLRDYLAHKAARDAGLRLIGSAEESVGAQESRL